MKKILFLLSILIIVGCSSSSKLNYIKAVWWWDNSLGDEYLEFARDNQINEIYYCDSNFNEETEKFISKANSYGMSVYYLQGEYQWIEDKTKLENKINNYLIFQENAKYKFNGIHLDIEPHQNPEFAIRRKELLTKFVELIIYLNKTYNIEFHYDIPFWFDDLLLINDIEKPAYEWIIDYSNRVVIMSYRDSKDGIFNVINDELNYANKVNKNIIISIETYSTEGDNVSFLEEGKKHMKKVIDDIFSNKPDGIIGIAIHHIKKWYELKE